MYEGITVPEELYDRISSNYRRGPLRILASKYIITCRVAITIAFSGDFSKRVSNDAVDDAMFATAKRLAELQDDIVPGGGFDMHERALELKRVCRDCEFISSDREDGTGEIVWSVTKHAKRAFDVMDTLSDGKESAFTSARLTMIVQQIETLEIGLSEDRERSVSILDERIDEYVRMRDAILAGTSTPMEPKQAVGIVRELGYMMRDMPNDIQDVADEIASRTLELTDALESHEVPFSDALHSYTSATMDILTSDAKGRSYLDALSIMPTDDFDALTERIVAIESADVVAGQIPRGFLSRQWDDMLRSIERVEDVSKRGTTAISSAAMRIMCSIGRESADKRAAALARIASDPCVGKRFEISLPWQYPMLADSIVLDYSYLMEYSEEQPSIASPVRARADDGKRLAMLSGPCTWKRVCEIAQAVSAMGDDEIIVVPEVFGSLPVSSRRVVEVLPLSDFLTANGGFLSERSIWKVIDSNGVECEWEGPRPLIVKRNLDTLAADCMPQFLKRAIGLHGLDDASEYVSDGQGAVLTIDSL